VTPRGAGLTAKVEARGAAASGPGTRYRIGMQKQSVWLFWIGSLAAMIFASGWVATVGLVIFGLLFVAHLVEFFMNRSLFEREGGSMGHHFVQTMIYGLFHWTPIKERLEAEEGGPAD